MHPLRMGFYDRWLRNVGGHTVDLTLVLVSATIIGLVTGSQWEPRNALSVSSVP